MQTMNVGDRVSFRKSHGTVEAVRKDYSGRNYFVRWDDGAAPWWFKAEDLRLLKK